MSKWLRAVWLLPVLAISACGGGGGGSSSALMANTAPTANFAFSCADLACSFTSTSTDQDVGDAIVAYSWTFGDGSTAPVATANASHVFSAGGAYDVTLMVADRSSVVSSVVRRVTVSAPPVPAAPHASFTASCVSLDCTFSDTSSYDAGSVFQSRTWDFGDGVTLPTASPASHSYAATALTTFAVKLTVADAVGKTSTSVQSIVVAPPATTLGCVGGSCVLNLTQPSRVSATLISHSCSARANQVVITSPVTQTVFADGCFDPVGTAVSVNGGSVFAAGTALQVAVLSGTFPDSTLVFPPSIRVTGDFANGWTLTFDDGYGGPGEPDFNDLVILVKASP
jgi:PKD repeat protein